MRNAMAVGCLAVVVVGCGGGEASLKEYAETLEALVLELGGQLEAADVRMSTATPTLEDAREVLTQALDARTEFQEAMTALDPPEGVAELHADLAGLHARIIAAQEAFATRAEVATGLEELDQSTEAQAYRAMVTESVSICQELQERIDATADNEIFADVPWVPGDMKEIVKVTFGC